MPTADAQQTKTPCDGCGTLILPQTRQKNSGYCAPCARLNKADTVLSAGNFALPRFLLDLVIRDPRDKLKSYGIQIIARADTDIIAQRVGGDLARRAFSHHFDTSADDLDVTIQGCVETKKRHYTTFAAVERAHFSVVADDQSMPGSTRRSKLARPNYSKLKEILISSTRDAIQEFAESVDNKEVYAVVFDTMEEYGAVILSLNTISALQERRKKSYPHYTDDDVSGLFGLKYNPGDFSFIDFGNVAKDQRDWARTFDEYLETLKTESAIQKNIERFSDTVAEAIRELRNDFQALDRTNDFVAFHCFHDSSDETVERLVRKTVDVSAFDRVFPEVSQGRDLLARIASLDVDEQASLWVGCLESFAFGKPSVLAKEFFKRHMWLDVKDQIVPIGPAAIPSVMKLLDDVIFERQFSEKGTEEHASVGAISRCSSTAFELLEILRCIGSLDGNTEEKLLGYFRKLQGEADDGDSVIGTNLMWVANTLHALVPQRYPPPDTTFNGNRVRNFQPFLQSE